jgi:outer membrane biosynthesis protein TonB
MMRASALLRGMLFMRACPLSPQHHHSLSKWRIVLMLNRALRLTLLLAVFALVLGFALVPVQVAFAQDAPAVDTPTSEPPTLTPTDVPTDVPTATPTNTLEPTPTSTLDPTATPTPDPGIQPTPEPTPAPTPEPVPIPEPITIALFGTGLAALSGVVARRRNKKD